MSFETTAYHRPRPLMTKWLLIINIGVFVTCLLTARNGENVSQSPIWTVAALSGLEISEGTDLWALFTYMFMHANLLHIAANMIGLWFFGRVLEDHLGKWHVLGIYLAGGLLGALLWLVFNWGEGVLVGASGSVLALVFAFTALYPRERVWLFPLPVPLQARWIAIGYLAITVGLALFSIGDGGNAGNIAHLAHLGGMAAGFFYAKNLENRRPQWDSWASSLPDAELGVEEPPPEIPTRREVMEAKDFVEKEVNPILEKVGRVGYGNLSEREKKILDRAQEILGRH